MEDNGKLFVAAGRGGRGIWKDAEVIDNQRDTGAWEEIFLAEIQNQSEVAGERNRTKQYISKFVFQQITETPNPHR